MNLNDLKINDEVAEFNDTIKKSDNESEESDEEIEESDEEAEESEAEESDEDYEASLKCSTYYQYYSSYVSPDGRKYRKDESTVPDELLIKYIDHMGYTKFTGGDFEFKYYSGYAKVKEYNIGKYQETRKYTMHDDKEIEEKLLEMINKDGCICHRPSFIYTFDRLIGNDCSFSDDLEDEEYSGLGSREVQYDSGTFTPI